MSEVYLCPICDYSGITKDIIEHFKSVHNENIRENPYTYTRSMSCKPLDIFLIFAFDSCFVVRSGYSVFTRKFTDNVQMLESDEELLPNYKFCLEVQSKNGILRKRKAVQPYNFFDLSDENSITTNSDVIVKILDTIDNLKFALSIIELKKNERLSSNYYNENLVSTSGRMEHLPSTTETSAGSRTINISSNSENLPDSPSGSGRRNMSNENLSMTSHRQLKESNISNSLNVLPSNHNENLVSASRRARHLLSKTGTPVGSRSIISSNSENLPVWLKSAIRNSSMTTQSEELTGSNISSRLDVLPSNANANMVSPSVLSTWRSRRAGHLTSKPGTSAGFRRSNIFSNSENLPGLSSGTGRSNIAHGNSTSNYSIIVQNEESTRSNISSSFIDLPSDDNENLVSPFVSWRSRRIQHLRSKTGTPAESRGFNISSNLPVLSSGGGRRYPSMTIQNEESSGPNLVSPFVSRRQIPAGSRRVNISSSSVENLPVLSTASVRRNIANGNSTSNSSIIIQNEDSARSNTSSGLFDNDNDNLVSPLVSWRSRRREHLPFRTTISGGSRRKVFRDPKNHYF